ncbi:MAG TPA: aldo/keto reductase, partial [Firmicutes bacterium]|jgi:aryl-alcohol dehydrogenase-like predicted oxidoreductase|nr:aldo/keto reductase [Bacillota bacterium]
MLNRWIEPEVIPVCEKHGIGQIVFSPLAQGLLTGKYRGGRVPEGSRAANPEINLWLKELIASGVIQKVDALQDLAEEAGLTLAEMSLAWILRQPNVASALVGASRPEQIEANVKAVEVELSSELLDKIEAILS